MDTTRRFPRTSAEAFKGADYASAITCYRSQSSSALLRAIVWLCVIFFLLGAAFR
jgi:hypothetical protein